MEDGYGEHSGHVTLPEFEAGVEAEEQDVHDGALCGAEYPLAVPILVPRLIQVVERNPPVIVAAQGVTACVRGAMFDKRTRRARWRGWAGRRPSAGGRPRASRKTS